MAELVAKEIYNIRESKNALLRGEADNMPQDGAQLKIMLDNLNMQERAMTEMFSGTLKEEPKTFTIRLTPKEMNNEIAFRFSKRLGVVANDDLAGEPYYITITDMKTPAIPEDDGKKEGGRNCLQRSGTCPYHADRQQQESIRRWAAYHAIRHDRIPCPRIIQ